MFEVNAEKFEEGRAAYARGASVKGLAEAVERHHQAFERREREMPPGERPDYHAEEVAGKSLILGFVDGLVSDIRKIVGGVRGGLRA